METRKLWGFVLAVALVGGGGCSSSDGEIDVTLLQLAECTAVGLQDLAGVFDGLLDVMEAVANPGLPLPPGVTYNEASGTFSVEIDVNDDQVTDATVSGTVSSTFDLSDGIQVGESALADWAIFTGTLGGSGSMLFDRLATDLLNVTGDGDITTGSGCGFAFSNADLDVDLSGSGDGPPVGTIDFVVSEGTDSLSGTITMNGTTTASVTATWSGATVTFRINLDSWVPSF